MAPAGSGGADAYVRQLRAEFTPENRAYSTIRVRLAFLAPLYGIAVALLLLGSGLSARFRDLAYRVARGRYLRMLVYFALFVVAVTVLELPLSVYRGYLLEHRFGLSNQSFPAWLGEQGTDVLVTILFMGATGLVALAYLAVERSPRRWWLWLALGSLPVIVAATLITPVLIDPLYNKFTPLRDAVLKEKIVALAERAGIPGRRVYQVDKSKQTKKLNAYVNGFGASQRIVLWDTTLERMSEDEILFVMGHEMGHYRLAHIWKGILFYCVLSVVLFWLMGVLTRAGMRRFGGRWGFHELHDPASLPLFVASLTLVGFLSGPLTNGYSRLIERESDLFALELTHLNDAGARAFIKLAAQNKSNPEPSAVVKHFLYTHPPVIERVRFALAYRPWEQGTPNRMYRPPTSSR